MQIDLQGRVHNTRLPTRHGLMPLFEAVVNSIHAIQAARISDGEIRIGIVRSDSLFSRDVHGNTLPDIIEFSVTDNGEGFTEENFRSFDTLDSRRKASLGGKGVGRLLWLKAFSRISVHSVYLEHGKWRERQFRFLLTPSGVEEHTCQPANGKSGSNRTSVRLIDFHSAYRHASPKSAQAIGRRIVEHCLHYYLLDNMPRVILDDPQCEDTIDLSQLYLAEFSPQSQRRTFNVAGEEFTLVDVLLKTVGDADHSLHFCADRRVVQTSKLSGILPHLDAPLHNADGTPVIYWGCVTAKLLDEHVDSDRTGFNLDREGDLGVHGGISWEAIEKAAVEAVSEYLTPRTEETRKAAFERIRNYIEQKAPRYRPLLNHRRAALERLSGTLSEEKLDLELHQLLNDWRQAIRAEVSRSLQSLPDDSDSFAKFRSEFIRLIGDVQEVAKSDLAEYVMSRAAVLSFFDKLLAADNDGKFSREDALHQLFFPRRTTSDDVDYDAHNLWVLDERLAYHQFLASDMPFSKQKASPIAVSSADRADILIYNHPVAFAPGEPPLASVVVVEFKRPERNDYDDSENPILQVYDYVKQIREGRARRRDGSSLLPPPEGTPFYCYIVASLTPKLREQALNASFTEAPDRHGFFHFNPNFKTYVELADYRKVLDDARKRNRVFFDRLGIHS